MRQLILSSGLIILAIFPVKALSHNVKTNADVGVTFHIEPDHSPRVGQESQAWFALTRQGGELISLSECDCELKVYLESQGETDDEPILNPTLIAISPEQYRDIPGANVTFPQPGIYQLELTGKPTEAGDFTAFQVSYPVTVKPGIAASETEAIPQENTASEEQTNISEPEETNESARVALEPEATETSSQVYLWLIAAVVAGLGIVAIFKLLQNKQKK